MPTLQFTAQNPADVLAIFNDLDSRHLTDRRSGIRTPFQAQLLATPLTHPNNRAVQILARDISQQGLGGITRIPLVVGHEYALPIALSANSQKLLRCRVVFSRSIRGGMFEVGLHFDEVVDGAMGLAPIPAHWIESAI